MAKTEKLFCVRSSVTLAAVLVAWWLDRRNSAAELVEAEARLIAAEEKVDGLIGRYPNLYASVQQRGIEMIETHWPGFEYKTPATQPAK